MGFLKILQNLKIFVVICSNICYNSFKDLGYEISNK